MFQTGVVTELNGENAVVRFKRVKACKNCNMCMTIGDNESVVELNNNLGAKVGDYVSVELHAKSILQASLIAYVFPLVALLIGLGVGSLVNDTVGIAAGLVLLLGAFLTIRLLEPVFARKGKFSPRMVTLEETAHKN